MSRKITIEITVKREEEFATDKQGVLAEIDACLLACRVPIKEGLRGDGNTKTVVGGSRVSATVKAKL